MFIAEFNSAMGFDPQVLTCDFSPKFDATSMHANFCEHPLDAHCLNKSKDLFLRNPYLNYLHRFLAYSFSGCKDASNILTKTKPFFLWCMVYE